MMQRPGSTEEKDWMRAAAVKHRRSSRVRAAAQRDPRRFFRPYQWAKHIQDGCQAVFVPTRPFFLCSAFNNACDNIDLLSKQNLDINSPETGQSPSAASRSAPWACCWGLSARMLFEWMYRQAICCAGRASWGSSPPYFGVEYRPG